MTVIVCLLIFIAAGFIFRFIQYCRQSLSDTKCEPETEHHEHDEPVIYVCSGCKDVHWKPTVNTMLIKLSAVFIGISGLSPLFFLPENPLNNLLKIISIFVTACAISVVNVVSFPCLYNLYLMRSIHRICAFFFSAGLLIALRQNVFSQIFWIGEKTPYLCGLIVGLVISLIYFFLYCSCGSKICGFVSIAAQIGTVVFSALMLKNDIYTIFSALLIYSFVCILLTKNSFFHKFYMMFPAAVGALMLLSLGEKSMCAILSISLLVFNMFLVYLNKKNKFNAYTLNVSLAFLGYYIICYKNTFMDSFVSVLLFITYILCVFAAEKIFVYIYGNKELDSSINIVTLSSLALTLLSDLTANGFDLHNTCILCAIGGMISLLIYFTTIAEESKIISSVVSSTLFIFSLMCIPAEFGSDSYVYLALAFCISAVPIIFEKVPFSDCMKIFKDGMFRACQISGISIFAAGIMLPSDMTHFAKYAVFSLLFILICVYNTIFGQRFKSLHKYFAYVVGIALLNRINMQFLAETAVDFLWQIPVAVAAIMFLENKFAVLHDKYSNGVVTAVQFLSLICLAETAKSDVSYAIVLALIFGIIAGINIMFKNKPCLNPLIVGTACIVTLLVLDISPISILTMAAVVALVTWLSAVHRCKAYTILSVAGIIIFALHMPTDMFGYLSVFAWATANVRIFKDKCGISAIKAVQYVSGASLYYSLAKYLELTDYAVFAMLGAVVALFLILENIISAKLPVSALKSIEYISFATTYFMGIMLCDGLLDSVLFILLIVLISAMALIRGRAAIFITGVFSAIVCIVITLNTYFSSAWWICLVLLASAIILISVENERRRYSDSLKPITLKSVIAKLSSLCGDDENKNNK